MTRAHLCVTALLLGLSGCGGARGQSTHLEPLFEAEEAARAADLAPDIHAQAEQAREMASRALDEGDGDAAEDHTTRARLLLEAAQIEAQRIELERKRLALETQTEEATARALRDEQARMAIDKEVSRLLAARVANEQAEKAFEEAAQYETRRHRARGASAERSYREASTFIIRRAQLVLAAARAMGAGEEATANPRALLEKAGEERDATRRLALADEALSAALGVLGQVRSAMEAPTQDMTAGLAAGARERGFDPRRLEEGLSVRGLGRLDRGRASQLADLLSAFPHGPVLVVVGGNRRRAEAEARRVIRKLVQAGAEEPRLRAEVREGDSQTGATLLFPAYSHP